MLKHFAHCCMKQFIILNSYRGNYDLLVYLCKTDCVTQVGAVPQVQFFFFFSTRVFKKYLNLKFIQ